jgi:hypothetical protein
MNGKWVLSGGHGASVALFIVIDWGTLLAHYNVHKTGHQGHMEHATRSGAVYIFIYTRLHGVTHHKAKQTPRVLVHAKYTD